MAYDCRSDIAIVNQGIRNANDGLSTLQPKDGALNNISNLLDRLATRRSAPAMWRCFLEPTAITSMASRVTRLAIGLVTL